MDYGKCDSALGSDATRLLLFYSVSWQLEGVAFWLLQQTEGWAEKNLGYIIFTWLHEENASEEIELLIRLRRYSRGISSYSIMENAY